MASKLATFLVVFICLTTIFSSVTFYILSPKPTQPFMGFGVFSHQGLQGYVPDNMTITPPQTLDWNLTATNRTGREQFVAVIVRIGNTTTSSPNVTSPANLPELGRIERFVNDGETSNINFTWTVESSNQTGNLVLLNLQINGSSVSSCQSAGSSCVGAVSGSRFRLIFELWTLDPVSGSFQYGYPGEFSQVGTWLQVWFSVSS